jgi:anti-sigma B factor antagonist
MNGEPPWPEMQPLRTAQPSTRRAAMHDEPLCVEVTHADRISVVTVTGEIDVDSMLALQAPLSELSPQSHIVLDMSRVRFMDSSGLKVILGQRIKMTEAGGSIHIRHASPAVQRVVQVSGLTDLLTESDTPQ